MYFTRIVHVSVLLKRKNGAETQFCGNKEFDHRDRSVTIAVNCRVHLMMETITKKTTSLGHTLML